MDDTRLYDPCGITLYFKTARGTYRVGSGETAKFEFWTFFIAGFSRIFSLGDTGWGPVSLKGRKAMISA